MAACWLLAIVLGFASTPLYAYPTARPGGLSAIGDQHLAAGVMWVPGSLPFVVAAVLFAYRWLEPAVRRDTRTAVTEVAR
jgi:cytochrome c oxidase assembly factor CtaG